MSGSRDGIRQQHKGEAQPSCVVEISLLCSFSGLHEGDGKIFAKSFHCALAQSSYSLQVPFKPEVKNVLKPTRGDT